MVHLLWVFGLAATLASAGPVPEPVSERNFTVWWDHTPHAPEGLEGTNATVAVTPHVLSPDSPLLNSSGLSARGDLETRTAIETTVAVATVVGAAAGVILAGNAGIDIYTYIAGVIEAKSNANSCTLTYGTDTADAATMGYAYQATTTGSNCDTTAIQATVLSAVESCASSLHNAGAVSGCCRFSHGGTWTGHLRLTANTSSYPVTSVTC